MGALVKKTRHEWEQEFTSTLVRLRDFYLQEDPLDLIGPKHSKMIESILVGYFRERRSRIPIKEPSVYMNFEDMAAFINNIVLDYINDEHPDLLEIDWQNNYILKQEDKDFFYNEEDF